MGVRNTHGISTLEVLIAFAILTLALATVILVVFGNQSVAIQTQAMHRALYIARDAIDSNYHDFDTIVSDERTVEDIFTITRQVYDATPCSKYVSADVTWSERSRPLSIGTMLVGFDYIRDRGGDCDIAALTQEWERFDYARTSLTNQTDRLLGAVRAMDIAYSDGEPIAVFGGSGATDESGVGTESKLWLATFADPDEMAITRSALETSFIGDITALDAIDGYVFAGSSDTDSGAAYLNIIELDGSSLLPWSRSFQLQGVDLSGEGGEINAVLYNDGIVYVGLDDVKGDELFIFDMSDPLVSSSEVRYASLPMEGHNIHDIAYRDGYLLLAMSDNENELTVVDVRSPFQPKIMLADDNRIDLSGNHDAESIAVIGSHVYIGREGNSGSEMNELYMFSISTGEPTFTLISSIDYGTNFNGANDRIDAIVPKGELLFALTGEDVRVYRIHSNRLEPVEGCREISGSDTHIDMDSYGEYIIFTVEDGGVFHITDATDVCTTF